MQLNEMKRNTRKAFTLIEMLVVIAIIAILAAMVLWGAGPAMVKAKLSRVRTEMTTLQTAIESYKERKGSYPPDNPNDPTTPPLFYELLGTVVLPNNADNIYSNTVAPVVKQSEIKKYFNRNGFQNSSPDPGEVENFFKGGLPRSQYKEMPDNSTAQIQLLTAPVDGPGYTNIPDVVQIAGPDPTNTWRYRISGTNMHNPGKYDLWADVIIRGKVYTVGNWKQP